jgi:hypothetical protein
MPLTFTDALRRATTIPTRLETFKSTLNLTVRVANFLLRYIAYVLAIFIIYSLFFWLARDPERAFDYATLVVDVIEIVFDIFGILWNPFAELLNSAFIPLWNAVTFHVIEPLVFLILEVFSLVFLRQKYGGIIKEEDFEYGGFACLENEISSAWCGRFGAYNDRLISSNSLSKTDSTTFGVATARRLSELASEINVDVPAFSTTELTGALDGLTTQAVVMGGSGADLFFGVLYNILSTVAVFIFDAVFIILKTVFDVIKLIIKSGLLQTLIGIGVDFILIMAIEIALPALFVGIDGIVCLFQLFMWDSWPEQLDCADLKCWKGPDAAADFWMFSSVPVVIERLGSILEAVINSRTGRAMTGAAGKVDIGVGNLDEVFPSLASTGCTACFVCKVSPSPMHTRTHAHVFTQHP